MPPASFQTDATCARKAANIRIVMDSLRRIFRELRLCARDAERGAGISGAQLFVLQALAEAQASSLNDLADRTLTDQSSVSVVVRRLADQGLLARNASTKDARRVELSLTAAGRRLLARYPELTPARRLVEALRRLDASELSVLTSGLAALVREIAIKDAVLERLSDDEAPVRATSRVAVPPVERQPTRRRNSRTGA
jgi:DNA-binding MarR family transcriptional regulator